MYTDVDRHADYRSKARSLQLPYAESTPLVLRSAPVWPWGCPSVYCRNSTPSHLTNHRDVPFG